MKRKNGIILLCVICLFAVFLAYPTTASAKPAPRQFTLSAKKLTLYAGESQTLRVSSVKPKKASKAAVFRSQNPKVASVSAQGEVLAKKAGKTEIVVISQKNPNVKASIKLTVKKRPKKTEKTYMPRAGIYELTGIDSAALQQTLKGLYKSGQNGYEVIPTKEEFQILTQNLKKNGYKDGRKFLQSFADADFKSKSLVILKSMLFRTYDERIAGFTAKFDASGRLCGAVAVRYKKQEDVPGMAYPQVMDEYMIILELPKKDIAMMDYFQCEAAEEANTP